MIDGPMIAGIDAFWLWLALGCLLLALEVLAASTGFFLCLGSAALVVALLTFALPSLSWLWAASVYAALAVLSIGFWFTVMRKNRALRAADEQQLNLKSRQLLGYTTRLSEGLSSGRGRLRVNDSDWPVQADRDYPAGTLVEVVDVRGITLIVRAVEEKNG